MPNLCIIPARALTELAAGALSATDIVILCAIGEHTDRNGEGCWASAATLATATGVHRSTFFSSTKRLIEAGLIERESGKDEGRSSTYRVVLDRQGVSRQQDTPRRAGKTPVSTQADAPTMNDPSNDPLNESPSAAQRITAAISNDKIIEDLHATDEHALVAWRGRTICIAGYLPDLQALAYRIDKAGGQVAAWLAELAAATEGIHGAPLTPEQVSRAVRDFNAAGGDISLRLFRGYLRDAAKPPKEVTVDGGRQQGKTSTLDAMKMIKRVRAIESKQYPGLPDAKWRDSFNEQEQEFLSLFGLQRIIGDKNEGTLVAQLSRAMQEAGL